MKIINGIKKFDRRERYMRTKQVTKNLFNTLLEQSTNDWDTLCANCTTLMKEANMSNEDIDEIVERVKKENG